MSEHGENVSNELLDELQRIPSLMRRAHHGAKRRMLKAAKRSGHWGTDCDGALGGFPESGEGERPDSGKRGERPDSGERPAAGHQGYEQPGHGKEHDPRHHGHGKNGRHGHAGWGHPGGRGQSKLLKLLLEQDGILMKDIVEELDIRPSSASELVAKLEKRGFVRTETDAHDKRAKRVYTTEKTREYFDRLKDTHSGMIAEVLAALTPEEQRQLLTLLQKIATSFEERPEAPAQTQE